MDRENRFVLEFPTPSLTKQCHKDECDINLIMKRFRNTQQGMDFLDAYKNAFAGDYGDFSNVGDYRSALDQVNRAAGLFGALPAKVRSRFGNDPALFLDFAGDPRNVDEMVSLGLAVKRPPVQDAVSKPASTGKDATG